MFFETYSRLIVHVSIYSKIIESYIYIYVNLHIYIYTLIGVVWLGYDIAQED